MAKNFHQNSTRKYIFYSARNIWEKSHFNFERILDPLILLDLRAKKHNKNKADFDMDKIGSVRLRIWWGTPCRFDSCYPHFLKARADHILFSAFFVFCHS